MTNERRSSPLQFDGDILRRKGFVQRPDGTWAKPDAAVDRLETGEHTQQAGALERKAQKARKRKAGGTKSGRRKRTAEIIVTVTAHLPSYLDDDNLAGALKPVRDELADWLGVDDGDRRVLWECDQTLTRGKPGVCVVVRPNTEE